MQTAFAVGLPAAIITALAYAATNAYRHRQPWRVKPGRKETDQ